MSVRHDGCHALSVVSDMHAHDHFAGQVPVAWAPQDRAVRERFSTARLGG